MTTVLLLALYLALPPLLVGIVNRVKAILAGRRGPPLWQVYADLARLARKGAVYSRTTTWVFRAGPIVGLAAVAALFVGLRHGRGRAMQHRHAQRRGGQAQQCEAIARAGPGLGVRHLLRLFGNGDGGPEAPVREADGPPVPQARAGGPAHEVTGPSTV